MGLRNVVKSLRLSKQACPASRTSLSARKLTHQREDLKAEIEHTPFVACENQRDDPRAEPKHRTKAYFIHSKLETGKQPGGRARV